MSEAVKDGGPAFPEPFIYDPNRGESGVEVCATDVGCGGMTLRDYFAAAAMTGLIAQSQGTAIGSDVGGGAIYCYRFADAMLQERSRTQ